MKYNIIHIFVVLLRRHENWFIYLIELKVGEGPSVGLLLTLLGDLSWKIRFLGLKKREWWGGVFKQKVKSEGTIVENEEMGNSNNFIICGFAEKDRKWMGPTPANSNLGAGACWLTTGCASLCVAQATVKYALAFCNFQ